MSVVRRTVQIVSSTGSSSASAAAVSAHSARMRHRASVRMRFVMVFPPFLILTGLACF